MGKWDVNELLGYLCDKLLLAYLKWVIPKHRQAGRSNDNDKVEEVEGECPYLAIVWRVNGRFKNLIGLTM